MNSYIELESVICYFWKKYSDYNAEWLKESHKSINYKKICVSQIEFDNEIYDEILSYLRFVENKAMFFIRDGQRYNMACRAKNKSSMDDKIERYKSNERYSFGQVPINKCLNDIFGARVIIEKKLSCEEIEKLIYESLPELRNNLKCTDSSKDGYTATHIYFKKTNHILPWELQVWYVGDVAQNKEMHKIYKQAYTLWEKKIGEEEA